MILQNPRVAFRDPLLQGCRIQRNALNQPQVWSGQFAVVFKGVDLQGKAWAIRAFTTASRDRRKLYDCIGAHLNSRKLRCLVDFDYREAAIRSAGDGKWYPLVVMDWVEGVTLFTWLQAKCRAGKGASIAKAGRHWLALVDELARANIAHGDLQHANVLVTPQGRLKLVDYDGMCVPALVGRRNHEVGVRPYQHPQRDEETLLSLQLDHFPSLMVYVVLRALQADTSLWARYVEQPGYDKLLFRSEDFLYPMQSNLYGDLMHSPDPSVRELTAQLFSLALGRMDDVPALREVLATKSQPVRPEIPSRAVKQATPQAGARVVLEVRAGNTAPRVFALDHQDSLLVGRGTDCHIRIKDDPLVSRHQLLLEVIPPRAHLRDLGSCNGTFVNGVRYGGRSTTAGAHESAARQKVEVDLKHGDEIRVGQTVIRVRIK
jgi:hypothetical protein